ncbi:phage tail tape measure protein [Cronobacter malonaticus]
MADSFELKAIITAVDRLSAPLKGMQRQLKGFQKELSGLTVGAGVAGSAILGAIAGASKEAMGLENNMADARKAIEELHDPKAFQKMTNDIVDMSTRLPMAAEGIAEIVAEAGNAGIPFNELTRFAEDATKAAVGFGMTAADAGHQLAVWRTSFKLTQDEVMALSDQMNYLAMTGPTTEKKIGAVVTSVGNLATTAGVSTRDLAAIAATITGVGVDADVAGTGVQNFMLSRVPQETWQLLAEAGVNVTVNPRSDALFGFDDESFAYQQAVNHGLTPALGIDLDTAFGSDMFGEMHALFGQQRSAMRYRRFGGEENVPAPITVAAVLKAATVNGARAAGLEDQIGTLTPGKQADIIMVRTSGVAVFPVTNVTGTVVQAIERADVDTVMVAGQLRKRAGQLIDVDLAALEADITASRDYLIKASGWHVDRFTAA